MDKKKAASTETASAGIDYSKYEMSTKERLLYILAAAAVIFAVGYIFYQNVIVHCI